MSKLPLASALSPPTAESLRRLHRKLDRRCARAAESLAALRDEGGRHTARARFLGGTPAPGCSCRRLACANVVAVNDLLGNAQTPTNSSTQT